MATNNTNLNNLAITKLATNLNNSAITKLAAALSKMKTDSDFADLTVTCGDKKWEVHSAVLAVRSPFFKTAISTNMAEKLDMKIDIKELDSETMEEVINFMYGIGIGKAPIRSLLEAAERFQMDDLMEDVVKLVKNMMSVENVIEIGQLAEMYNLGGDILDECAQFIVKNGVPMKEDDLSPKFAALVIGILQLFTAAIFVMSSSQVSGSRRIILKDVNMLKNWPNLSLRNRCMKSLIFVYGASD